MLYVCQPDPPHTQLWGSGLLVLQVKVWAATVHDRQVLRNGDYFRAFFRQRNQPDVRPGARQLSG